MTSTCIGTLGHDARAPHNKVIPPTLGVNVGPEPVSLDFPPLEKGKEEEEANEPLPPSSVLSPQDGTDSADCVSSTNISSSLTPDSERAVICRAGRLCTVTVAITGSELMCAHPPIILARTTKYAQSNSGKKGPSWPNRWEVLRRGGGVVSLATDPRFVFVHGQKWILDRSPEHIDTPISHLKSGQYQLAMRRRIGQWVCCVELRGSRR
ncbi:hypothetical protein BGZ61DRAFT_436838 [Ilyonectria robusta]|uniref:uncharacterized protein n=1 Tax=Ilyonectria robusta TaxID=1079257 RepID=UPI001E8E560C|nr:uncharacterized protein BGZ61DRAFT_436838 [Ilyonectria robusta]KAH8736693.1 hypothetical protein BGZ61DRAFT_436838 [Ilyonectria robusta]